MASLVSAPASLARLVRPIHGEDELEQLLDLLAEARIVVLGAASYGTHEHYDLRASLTRKLIRHRDFSAVVIEADWPDALRVDRYVRNQSDDDSASTALLPFDHFPAWAWRNDDVVRFIEWLRIHNACTPRRAHAGFYGIDVFSMNAALRALRRHADENPDEIVAELVDMQWRHAARSGRSPAGTAWLNAMSAFSVRHAESYYHTLLAGGDPAWNQRSAHMVQVLDMLAQQFPKLVVWLHDMHAGDARASDEARSSVGQLLRERHGEQVALVGFTTYQGTVRCARDWDEPGRVESLAPAPATSWEALFHETGVPRFMITASGLRRATGEHVSRLHRSIGAQRELVAETRLAERYDVVVHVDTTRAVEPLVERSAGETQAMDRDAGLESRDAG